MWAIITLIVCVYAFPIAWIIAGARADRERTKLLLLHAEEANKRATEALESVNIPYIEITEQKLLPCGEQKGVLLLPHTPDANYCKSCGRHWTKCFDLEESVAITREGTIKF